LWLLVGFSGHGMPYAQVLPKFVADSLAGAAPPPLPTPLSPARYLFGE
jgi:glycine/D-amino acid oxidase-like deaminating enzyme